MTEVGPMFLAAVLAETFEHFDDDAHGREAGELLHVALTRHGYRLTPIEGDRAAQRDALNEAALSAVRRFAGVADAIGRDLDCAARAMAALDVEPGEARRIEDAAWASVELHGSWRELTKPMTTEQKTAAADAVERHWNLIEADDPGLTHEASRVALRWWES